MLYRFPALVLVGSGFFAMNEAVRGVLWAAGLGTMGIACLVILLRCGRVHCYVTGPFFMALAIVALLYGLGV